MLFKVPAELVDSEFVFGNDLLHGICFLVAESVLVRAKGVLLVSRRKLLCQLLDLFGEVKLVVARARPHRVLRRVAKQTGTLGFDILELAVLVDFIESVQSAET